VKTREFYILVDTEEGSTFITQGCVSTLYFALQTTITMLLYLDCLVYWKSMSDQSIQPVCLIGNRLFTLYISFVWFSLVANRPVYLQ